MTTEIHLAFSASDAPSVAHRFGDDGVIPNNENLPLVVYPGVVELPSRDPAAIFERLFGTHQWTGSWRNGIFGFHHYHSTAHEVLGIYSGSATVQVGGDSGVVLTVHAGDVVVIPAGVGHRKLATGGRLGVVGAYPAGQSPDLRRGEPGDRAPSLRNISEVPLPRLDPVFGPAGPLATHWKLSPAGPGLDHG